MPFVTLLDQFQIFLVLLLQGFGRYGKLQHQFSGTPFVVSHWTIEAAYPIPGGGNGVGVSPDGRVVYVAETETGRLWAWDIIGTATLKKQPWHASPHGGRLVCQLPGYRRLDSLAIAASGNIVVATLMAGEITTISPGGEIVDVKEMPDIMPTNICFGGPGMFIAWITLSTKGRLAELPWREPGLRLPFG